MFQNYCVNKAEFLNENKIAYTTVYKKDLEKFSAGDDYTDGIAETLRAIDSTEVAFVVKEVDTKLTKVSMRSKRLMLLKSVHYLEAEVTLMQRDVLLKLLLRILLKNYYEIKL